MTCNFTSFSTVFKLYQDHGRVILKSVCKVTLFMPLLELSQRGDSKEGSENIFLFRNKKHYLRIIIKVQFYLDFCYSLKVFKQVFFFF